MSKLIDRFEKEFDKFLEIKVNLSTSFLMASFALGIGINLAKSQWMPDSREISGYVEKGIQLYEKINTVKGGNEVLNPIYYVPNARFL